MRRLKNTKYCVIVYKIKQYMVFLRKSRNVEKIEKTEKIEIMD